MNDVRAGLTSPLLGLLGSLAVVACGATSNGAAAGGATGGTAAGAGSGSGGYGSSGGYGASGGSIIIEGPQCAPSVPVTTQIPRLLNRQYSNVVRDMLGVSDVAGTPVADALVEDFSGAMTATAWQVYQDVAAKIAAQVLAGPSKSLFIACDPAAAGCLKQTIETFGRKAFRRPLTEQEVARFEKLSNTTPPGTPAEVAEATLNAFLVSPSFLYLPELNTETEGTSIKLSTFEVASRLSFLLWGSIPDDELNDAAEHNLLASKEGILAQAQRMIQVRAKTGPTVSAFHDEWLSMSSSASQWFKIDHDPAVYPSYDPAAKASYKQELYRFFEEVAFTGGSFPDLLLSNVAFVNKDNAAIYGLDPATYTAELSKVTLDSSDQPRPGFLTRAGFLSSYAWFQGTNPILRGAFIARSLLDIDPGPPIPGAATMRPVEGDYTTQRQYVEALTEANQPCKACHEILNPFGFVLENYDALGKWQTRDLRGGVIDSSVTTATVNFGQGETKEIAGPLQLMNEIARSPAAQEKYAEAWVSFAYGRAPNANDQCVVDALRTRLSSDGYTILNLFADLTQTDSFRLRVTGAR